MASKTDETGAATFVQGKAVAIIRSVKAIFIKQSQDILRNMGVLVQFVVFPGMALIMTWVLNIEMEGLSDTFFISIFSSMFVGMTIISSTATAIAEDREKKSLRFLLMAGVKPHQYLIGVGGVFFVFAFVACSAFAAMMPGFLLFQRLLMLVSLLLGAVASILIGAVIGIVAKNEQAAVSIGTAAGMVVGFGPLLAEFSETIKTMLRSIYSMNFVYDSFLATDTTRQLLVILVNIIALALAFALVYKKCGLKL